MDAEYTEGGPAAYGQSRTTGGLQVDRQGSLFVNADLRYFRVLAADSDPVPNGPCNAILLSEDASVTFIGAEDTEAITLALRSGVFHPIAVGQLDAVSAGTVTGGWLRNPESTVTA